MATIIEIGSDIATLVAGRWQSDNEALAKLLNVMTDEMERTYYSPNPALDIAEYLADQLDGDVVSYDEVNYIKDRVY